MRRYLGIAVLSLALLVLLNTAPLVGFGEQQVVRVVVGIRGDSDYNASVGALSSMGSVVMEIPEIRAVVLVIPQGLVRGVAGLPFVRYVDYDRQMKILQGEVQWNVKIINATKVWETYKPLYGDAALGYNKTIHVAVVDTGINYRHPDLQGSVVWCVVSLGNNNTFYEGMNLNRCEDSVGHGTHVSGIIAARLNGFGVAGVAPKAMLYAVKVFESWWAWTSDIARGIVEATKGPDGVPGDDDDADVISMSFGGPNSSVLQDAIIYAYSHGVVLVAAAGNEGASQPSYPAAYQQVIAVGAIDINYQVPSWSNRNSTLVAPGVNVLSTWKGVLYAYASGTSMACPHVSATVALIQALRLASGHQKLSPDQVKSVLIETAIDLGPPGYDPAYGYGLVDAYGAVNYALSLP